MDTMLYFTTHETSAESFYMSNDPVVNWEDPAASMTAGEYQVSEKEITGDYLLLRLSFSSSMEDGKAAWFHNVIALKQRLDALQQPYAAGLLGYDTHAFVVKTVPDAFSREELTIFLDKSLALNVGSKWDSSDIYYGLEWEGLDPEKEEISFSLSEYTRNSMLDAAGQLKKDGVSEAYLFCDSLPLASMPVDEIEKTLETPGEILTFSNLTFTWDPVFISFLRSCGRETLDDYSVSVDAMIRYRDRKEGFPVRMDETDLPEQFTSIFKDQEELISKAADFTEKAGGSITTRSDRAEGLSVSFWFYDMEEEKIAQFASEFAADFCGRFKEPIRQGEFARLYFYFDVNEDGNEDRERLYFSLIKPYPLKHMQLYKLATNDTKADDNEVLEALVSALEEVSGLEDLVPEDMAVE